MKQKLSIRQAKDLAFMVSKAYSSVNSAWAVLYDLDDFPFVEFVYKGGRICLNRIDMMTNLNTVCLYFSELLEKLSDYDKD